MKAREARYLISATKASGYPPESVPEFAFAGRSNVGKSTLINALVGKAKLARASNTPGRTRLLNWFEVEPPKGSTMNFVDLPGYGYAKVPKEMRSAWRPMVEAYLARRATLRLVFVLIDARRGPEADDRDLLDWLGEMGVPAVVVLTKADKLKKSQRKLAAQKAKKELGLAREPILSAAESLEGLSALWRIIASVS